MTAMGYDLPLIAKIEKPRAAANAEEIVDAADGVMVARGDLGIELPIEEVPLAQKRILRGGGERASRRSRRRRCSKSMVTVHAAHARGGHRRGQRHLRRHRRRDALAGDRDGRAPCAGRGDDGLDRRDHRARASLRALAGRAWPAWGDEAAAIAYGAVGAIDALGLAALVVPTYTGTTARLMSSHRPSVPVLAICPDQRIARRCELYWGVQTTVHPEPEDTTELIAMCARAAIGAGVAAHGDRIGITAGLPAGRSGGTNLFKVHTI